MNIHKKHLSRRDFVALSAISGTALATGCAVNPVTGKQQFMLVSEADEISSDQQVSPHQFSSDYGTVQDSKLNKYITDVGNKMARLSHRPQMPYNYRVLNTVVVNGYTFPGGSMGLARGLMLSMQNEAQLAAVLGHEIGHVNWRHGSERSSKTILAALGVGVLAAWAGSENSDMGSLAQVGGVITATLLLNKYSRQDEREADASGMEYMTRAEHNPKGMIGLMDIFVNLHTSKPNVVDALFSTHPMSDERYKTAKEMANDSYAFAKDFPLNRERYMDNIASIRKIGGAIEAIQTAGKYLGKEKYSDAESSLKKALKVAPDDYAALLVMAKCQMLQKKYSSASSYAEKAKLVYPEEPQAVFLNGVVLQEMKKYSSALIEFNEYEKKLPGNPSTTFYIGYCNEYTGKREIAANMYGKYLKSVSSGDFAKHARQRLKEWGYITA